MTVSTTAKATELDNKTLASLYGEICGRDAMYGTLELHVRRGELRKEIDRRLAENKRLREQVELSRRDTEAFIRDLDDWQKRAEAAERQNVMRKRHYDVAIEFADHYKARAESYKKQYGELLKALGK